MELILNSSFSFFALLCIYLFFTILFLQSGLDKIFNWNTELNWIKEHFSKTIFRSQVPVLLFTLTLLEVITAIFCLLSLVHLITPIYEYLPFWGLFFSSCTLLSLFFGQRLAKDYQGAISIAIYFIINLLGLLILSF